MRLEAHDLHLDHPNRRKTQGGDRRALVHGFNDELVINWNGDYPGNVVVHKDLKIAKGGKLVIEDDKGNTVAKIDRWGNFEAGGNGEQDGDVLLNDKNGNRIIHIGAGEGKIEIKDTSGNTVAKIDRWGNFEAGGNGEVDGDVLLNDKNGNRIIHIGADEGKIEIKDTSGNTVAKIDRHGNFEAGGNGEVDGDVLLNDKNGNRIIHIGADEGKIEIKDTSGNTVAKIDKFGNLYLGGGGRDGDIILKDGNGNVLIRIDTQYKRIDFKDPSGSVKMRICTDDFTEATWPAWPEESSPSQLDLIKELRRMKEEILALRERVEELESSSP
ncbi:hypothetical protein [Candidatus Desulfofervidus auxilii]|uniref:hypothetical protein n=1 Tax=Desulfofervidus auxilii TaxID=1621989 RepID=UPI0012E77F46|nr:hypothetical protein [Candidatus Desulfofervidus auxilii]